VAEDSPSWPMDLFMNDRDLPLLELQQGAEIPPPYRDLLVHMREMTPTLEAYYGSSIHIEPLQVLDGQLRRAKAKQRPRVEYNPLVDN